MVKVKICGITNLDDALFCSRQGADAVGFIFTPASPRCIKVKDASRISGLMGPFITKVGVFLDEKKDNVLAAARTVGLDVLQFHGAESPAYCGAFQPEFKVIKVLFDRDRPFKKTVCKYKGVDAFLFDVKLEDKRKGVSSLSKVALEEVSRLIKEDHRVIISGGLRSNNVLKVKRLNPYAVDVASGVESRVGKKDKKLVREFIGKTKDLL